MVNHLCNTHKNKANDYTGLVKWGTPFLKGYCNLAEGEKDPRNLKLAFSIARVILLEFDIQECVEDLFDITFCYFPINFTPPKDDPYGITSEELQVALRFVFPCITFYCYAQRDGVQTRIISNTSLWTISTTFNIR
jgi:hypothetical protein